MKRIILSLMIFSLFANPIFSQVIAQWRGMDRNGCFDEENLLEVWPVEGPDLLWSSKVIGAGYSSASVTNDAIYISGLVDTLEYVSAYDLDGKLLWKSELGPGWNTSFNASRSTPLVVDDKVYALSGLGYLGCYNRFSGETIWKDNVYERFEGEHDIWGVVESLLYHGGKIIYTPCGKRTTIVAMDANTGRTVWESESFPDSSAYVSPVLINHNDKEMIIGVSSNYIFSTDPKDGRIIWKKTYSDINPPVEHIDFPIQNTNSPLYHDGQLYVTSGYNHVGVMFALNEEGNDAQLLWTDSTLDVHHGGAVLVDGYIYGSNWLNNGNGNWCCIDWVTGETMYEEKWINKGSIISANNKLYCYEERTGNIALVEADPEKFKIISQFRPIDQRGWQHWSRPVIKNGVMYLRFKDELRAYDIAKNS